MTRYIVRRTRNVFLGRQVGLECPRHAARRDNFIRNILRLWEVKIGERNGRAFACKHPGGRRANSAAGAGDQSHLAFKATGAGQT